MSYALRACSLLLAGVLSGLAVAADPPVPPVTDQANLGVGLQRTMTLLATSTAQQRKRVRILFYGQSITAQAWPGLVEADLRARFPHADLVVANKAISGFASQLLVKIAEHDIHTFQPDLVIFHVYGDNGAYGEIIRSIRTRTSAEVLLQTDHIGAGPEEDWTVFMNQVFIPDLASTYACGIADVRSAWRRYLDDNNLAPTKLLSDDIHPNDHGGFVMASIISQYLVHRPDLPDTPWRDLTRDVVPTGPGRRLTVSGGANGFEVLVGTVPTPISVTVTIDGQKPSEHPGCYLITRPAPPPPLSPVSLIRVDHDASLLVEDWTLTITWVATDGASWGYSVHGTRTGADGAGTSGADFISQSGRVVIKPTSWFKSWINQPPTVGAAFTWQVVPMFADQIVLQAGPAAHETFMTLAMGLPNEQHTLVLSAGSDLNAAIAAVRAHRPMGLTAGNTVVTVQSDDAGAGGGQPGAGAGAGSANDGGGGDGGRCGLGAALAALCALMLALTSRPGSRAVRGA